ncbi:sensor histidine kinase [Gracilinema caldarium]|uniref:histidine kinase n=1 Tax=Gracilinema caldarium (strain ATCC 51460 / DSM 7334 / H1) TaxID=744872 RepID=F8EY43_GRAC1|nr:HAMP domain-containing sensor histidine kinase [Gracilinema caldarium]AEJ20704.1 integral membrane sensor signal transduction histidine kinase [Gracilinema caldarium DSM 7334]
MKIQKDGNFFTRISARWTIDAETKERIRGKRAEIKRLKDEIHREFHLRQHRIEDEYFRDLLKLEGKIPRSHQRFGCSRVPDSALIRKYRIAWYRRKIGGIIAFVFLLIPPFFMGGFSFTIKILFSLIAFLLVLAQVAEFTLYVRFDRRILTPIARLEEASRSIAKGDYGVRVEQTGHSELLGLIESFNMMAKSLAESEALKAEYEKNRKELIASISHDLKTPITAILGYVEASSQIGFTDPVRIEKYTKVIAANASYMNHLIDDLFLFSKLDMHKLDFHFEETMLKPFIADLMQEFEIEFDWHGADFNYNDGIPENATAKLDVKRFIQVFNNIVDNAVKYGCKDKLMLYVSACVLGGSFVLTIRDNGPGVPEEKLVHVFERFYRVDGERTKDLGSTGLGLAIAKELVEAHGGTITVVNAPEGGLEFTITIPLSGGGENT